MKSLEDQVLESLPEIAKLVGTEVRRVSRPYDAYAEVPGGGYVLRVRWEIERTWGLVVTLYKEVKDDQFEPRELNLCWFVKWKGGPTEEEKMAGSPRVANVLPLVKKYLLGYLLGRENNFDEVAELAEREIEEKHHYSQWNKANKWVRPEWPPSN